MLFGNRGARSSGTKQRKSEAFRPRGEALEEKVLLALLQLGAGTPKDISNSGTTIPPAGPQTLGGQLPYIADSSGFNPQVQGTQTTDPGLGVLETGNNTAQQQTGYSVAAVGDMNNDGSPDFLVGTPNGSGAWLIFANNSASPPTSQSWLSLTPEQRVGVINNLGTTGQTNPFTNRAATTYAFNFNGVAFKDNSTSSELGAYVAAAGDNAFVIGDPTYGSGVLYYVQPVTGTAGFGVYAGQTINLDNPTAYSDLVIVKFTEAGTTPTGLGTSFAVLPNIFGGNTAGITDFAIGEPEASVNPSSSVTRTDNGAVYILASTLIPSAGGTNTSYTVSTQAQFTIVGAHSYDQAGYSLANAGDVNGATDSAGNDITDLLIGDPHYLQGTVAANGIGAAFLVYGGPSLTNGTTNGIVDLLGLSVRPTSTTGQAPAQGAVFVGSGSDAAGYSVSSAGSFNPGVDSLNDFMIGSPGGNGAAGRVNLFYGASTGTYTQFGTLGGFSAGLISTVTNPIQLNNPTAALALTGVSPLSASFVGAGGNFQAGTSISYVEGSGSIASTIIIGVPRDTTSGGLGSVYELLGPSTGTFQTQLLPLTNSVARQYTLADPTTVGSPSAILFGTSVSALADGDGDFIAGAPGYTGTLPTTSDGTTSPTANVGAAAIVIASLQPANTLPTLGSSSGGGGGGSSSGSGAVAGAVLPGTFHPTTYVSPLGTSFVPTVSALSAYNYAPIPLKVALEQYQPPDGFIQRIYAYYHPGKPLPPTLKQRGQNYSKEPFGSNGVHTLGSKVFDRGRFHPGKTYTWTHSSLHSATQGRVVPVQLSREKYTSAGNPLGKA